MAIRMMSLPIMRISLSVVPWSSSLPPRPRDATTMSASSVQDRIEHRADIGRIMRSVRVHEHDHIGVDRPDPDAQGVALSESVVGDDLRAVDASRSRACHRASARPRPAARRPQAAQPASTSPRLRPSSFAGTITATPPRGSFVRRVVTDLPESAAWERCGSARRDSSRNTLGSPARRADPSDSAGRSRSCRGAW